MGAAPEVLRMQARRRIAVSLPQPPAVVLLLLLAALVAPAGTQEAPAAEAAPCRPPDPAGGSSPARPLPSGPGAAPAHFQGGAWDFGDASSNTMGLQQYFRRNGSDGPQIVTLACFSAVNVRLAPPTPQRILQLLALGTLPADAPPGTLRLVSAQLQTDCASVSRLQQYLCGPSDVYGTVEMLDNAVTFHSWVGPGAVHLTNTSVTCMPAAGDSAAGAPRPCMLHEVRSGQQLNEALAASAPGPGPRLPSKVIVAANITAVQPQGPGGVINITHDITIQSWGGRETTYIWDMAYLVGVYSIGLGHNVTIKNMTLTSLAPTYIPPWLPPHVLSSLTLRIAAFVRHLNISYRQLNLADDTLLVPEGELQYMKYFITLMLSPVEEYRRKAEWLQLTDLEVLPPRVESDGLFIGSMVRHTVAFLRCRLVSVLPGVPPSDDQYLGLHRLLRSRVPLTAVARVMSEHDALYALTNLTSTDDEGFRWLFAQSDLYLGSPAWPKTPVPLQTHLTFECVGSLDCVPLSLQHVYGNAGHVFNHSLSGRVVHFSYRPRLLYVPPGKHMRIEGITLSQLPSRTQSQRYDPTDPLAVLGSMLWALELNPSSQVTLVNVTLVVSPDEVALLQQALSATAPPGADHFNGAPDAAASAGAATPATPASAVAVSATSGALYADANMTKAVQTFFGQSTVQVEPCGLHCLKISRAITPRYTADNLTLLGDSALLVNANVSSNANSSNGSSSSSNSNYTRATLQVLGVPFSTVDPAAVTTAAAAPAPAASGTDAGGSERRRGGPSLPGWAIALAVVGSLAGAALVVAGGAWGLVRSRRLREQQGGGPQHKPPDQASRAAAGGGQQLFPYGSGRGGGAEEQGGGDYFGLPLPFAHPNYDQMPGRGSSRGSSDVVGELMDSFERPPDDNCHADWHEATAAARPQGAGASSSPSASPSLSTPRRGAGSGMGLPGYAGAGAASEGETACACTLPRLGSVPHSSGSTALGQSGGVPSSHGMLRGEESSGQFPSGEGHHTQASLSRMHGQRGSASSSTRASDLHTTIAAMGAGMDFGDKTLVVNRILGKGASGTVYKGLWHGLEVAIKAMFLSPSDVDRSRQRALLEAAISSNLAHPNIVVTYSYELKPLANVHDLQFQTPEMAEGLGQGWRLCLIQEYCDGGSLREAIDGGVFVPPTPPVLLPSTSSVVSDIAASASSGSTQPVAAATDPLARVSRTLGAGVSTAAGARAGAEPGTPNASPSGAQGRSSDMMHARSRGSAVSVVMGSASATATAQPATAPVGGRSAPSEVLPASDEACAAHKQAAPAVAAPASAPASAAAAAAAATGPVQWPMGTGANVHALFVPKHCADMRRCLEAAIQIASGMQHIHSKNVVHGDLNPNNVLMVRAPAKPGLPYTCKVSDFGLSFRMNPGQTHVSNLYQGTPYYVAPEVLLSGRLAKSADVYAFGIMLWELHTASRPPWRTKQRLPGYPLLNTQLLAFHPACPTPFRDLARACFNTSREERPSFAGIVLRLQEIAAAELGGSDSSV